jgi:hypothetical protein
MATKFLTACCACFFVNNAANAGFVYIGSILLKESVCGKILRTFIVVLKINYAVIAGTLPR